MPQVRAPPEDSSTLPRRWSPTSPGLRVFGSSQEAGMRKLGTPLLLVAIGAVLGLLAAAPWHSLFPPPVTSAPRVAPETSTSKPFVPNVNLPRGRVLPSPAPNATEGPVWPSRSHPPAALKLAPSRAPGTPPPNADLGTLTRAVEQVFQNMTFDGGPESEGQNAERAEVDNGRQAEEAAYEAMKPRFEEALGDILGRLKGNVNLREALIEAAKQSQPKGGTGR